MCYHNVPKTINHRGYDLIDATTVQVLIYSQTLIVYYIGWLEINSYELSIFIIELWISVYQNDDRRSYLVIGFRGDTFTEIHNIA